MAAKRKTVMRYRSAVDGKFKKKAKAEAKPREHVKERVPIGRRRRKKK
jgi:hypothetical protein